MNLLNLVLIFSIVSSSLLSAAELEDARWTSKLLKHPDLAEGDTIQARAISQDDRGNLLIVTERRPADGGESSVVLFKTDSSGNVIWQKTAGKIKGIPFAISFESNTGSAFVIVSESKRNGNFARSHVVRFTNVSANNDLPKEEIGEDIFFSTPGRVGVTKLFGCVRHPGTGDLYVAGGTSASLYREKSLGKGDAIVIRLGPSGNVLSSNQFGSGDNEVVRSIALNSDGSALVVVTKRQFPSGTSTSDMYGLDPDNLSITDGPHSPYNHGEDPLFSPKSIAIAGPIASQANTQVTIVGGEGLVRPDSQADIYMHIYTKSAGKINEMTITFDGAKRLKGIDSCVSAHIGSDGNMYCLGYTELDGASVSRRLNLIVVSPTGELLFSSERAITEMIPPEETPTGSVIIESGIRRKIIYVGRASVNGKTEATVGFVELPKGSVRRFSGFNDVVTGAGSVVPQTTTATVATNPPSIAVIAGAAIGGVAVLAAVIAGFVVFNRRWRSDNGGSSKIRAPTVIEDYTREVHESFTDADTPREDNSRSGGALV